MSAAFVPKTKKQQLQIPGPRSSSSDGRVDSDVEMHAMRSAARKQPYQSSRASAQPQSQTEHEMGKKERTLIFVRVLMRYLEIHNPEMHTKGKAVIKECYEKNKRGDPAYKSLTKSMKTRLQFTVGETYWKRAENYLGHFLKQKQRARAGEQPPWSSQQPKPPPQKMIPQQQPPIIADERVPAQQKEKKEASAKPINEEYETNCKATARDTEIEEQQSTIAQLRKELAETDELLAKRDREINSMKAILKKIGLMANNTSEDTNQEDEEDPSSKHYRTENGDRKKREGELQSAIDQYKKENDALKEQLKNSKPIEVIEIEQSSGNDSHDGEPEPPSKRYKSNLAITLEQTHHMVKEKEEANQRAAAAEANLEVALHEKDAAQASMKEAQEDLEIQQWTTKQAAVASDTWQGRFEELFELARAAGVDENRLSEIRYRHYPRAVREEFFELFGF